VLTSFVLEAVILSAIGGAVGAAASMAMGFVRFSMVNFASWSEIVFSFDPTPQIITKALAFACGMGLFGGLLPAIRAAATSPLKAIRG
jgi:putative ABC transport system permease protein